MRSLHLMQRLLSRAVRSPSNELRRTKPATPQLGRRLRRRRSRRPWSLRDAAILLLPSFVVLGVFRGYSLLFGLRVATSDWSITGFGGWVGFEQFSAVLGDPEFWDSLRVTLYYVAITVPIGVVAALVVAVALQPKRRGRSVLRLGFFLPQVTSLVAAGIVFRWLFRSGPGPVNSVLDRVGIPSQAFLSDAQGVLAKLASSVGFDGPVPVEGPSLALLVVCLVTIWYYLGLSVVIYMAGLSAIPTEIYDAATVDGTNWWTRFRYITVPLVSPTTYVLVVISTIGAFQSFAVLLAVTGSGYGGTAASGAPLGTTRVLTLYIFDHFFRFGEYGFAMAAAFVLLAVVLIITIFYRVTLGRRVHYVGE